MLFNVYYYNKCSASNQITDRKLETNLPSIGAQHTLKDIACHFNPSSKDIENECFTLLNSLMILDPVDRLTAAEALEHPFFRDT